MFEDLLKQLRAALRASSESIALGKALDRERIETFRHRDFHGRHRTLAPYLVNSENALLLSAIALADRDLARIYTHGVPKFIPPDLREFPETINCVQSIVYRNLEEFFSDFVKSQPESRRLFANSVKSFVLRKAYQPFVDKVFGGGGIKLGLSICSDERRDAAEGRLKRALSGNIATLDEARIRNDIAAASLDIFRASNQAIADLCSIYISQALSHLGAARIVTISLFRFFGFEPSQQALSRAITCMQEIRGKDPITEFIVSSQNYLLFKLGDELLKRNVGYEQGCATMSRMAIDATDTSLLALLREVDSQVERRSPTDSSALSVALDHKCAQKSFESPATVKIVRDVVEQLAEQIDVRFKRSNSLRLARLIVYAAGKNDVSVAKLIHQLDEGVEPEQILDSLKLDVARVREPKRLSAQVSEAKHNFVEAVEVLGAVECRVQIANAPSRSSFISTIDSQLTSEERRQVVARLGRLAYGSTGSTRAILKNFKSTGVYELKSNSALRVYYAQTAEDEYTILGISRSKDQQARQAENAIEVLAALRKGEIGCIGLSELVN